MKIREQERKIQEQNVKIQEQESTLADIKKHIDEWDQKYTDLTSELVRARDDILSAAASIQRTPTSQQTSTPKTYKSNIKPRMTHILPKNYTNVLAFDVERKRKPISNLLPDIPIKRNRSLSEKDVIEDGEDVNKELPDLIDFKSRIKDGNNSDGCETTSTSVFSGDLSSIISNSIETLKNSLSSIKSRKRKSSEDIDLK